MVASRTRLDTLKRGKMSLQSRCCGVVFVCDVLVELFLDMAKLCLTLLLLLLNLLIRHRIPTPGSKC